MVCNAIEILQTIATSSATLAYTHQERCSSAHGARHRKDWRALAVRTRASGVNVQREGQRTLSASRACIQSAQLQRVQDVLRAWRRLVKRKAPESHSRARVNNTECEALRKVDTFTAPVVNHAYTPGLEKIDRAENLPTIQRYRYANEPLQRMFTPSVDEPELSYVQRLP